MSGGEKAGFLIAQMMERFQGSKNHCQSGKCGRLWRVQCGVFIGGIDYYGKVFGGNLADPCILGAFVGLLLLLLLPLLMWGLGVLAAKCHRGAPVWIKTNKQMLIMLIVAVGFGLYAGLTTTGGL